MQKHSRKLSVKPEEGCGIDYMEPVYELLHQYLLARDIIHADETPCQVLKEEGKKAQSKSYVAVCLRK